MNGDHPLRVGEIVHLSPDIPNRMFAGCLMVVTEPKPWGAQGYVQGLGVDGDPAGQAYLRPTWAHMERAGGMAVWMPHADEREADHD
jgi:hypothetical protein